MVFYYDIIGYAWFKATHENLYIVFIYASYFRDYLAKTLNLVENSFTVIIPFFKLMNSCNLIYMMLTQVMSFT